MIWQLACQETELEVFLYVVELITLYKFLQDGNRGRIYIYRPFSLQNVK